jgi:hypothetical protein
MDHDFFEDPDRLRLRSSQPERHSPANRKRAAQFPRTRRVNGEFVKGPLPLNWLSIACKLRGKSPLAVALAILFEVGRRKSNEIILTTAICERFGVSRKSKYRGLAALESASLILVARRPRKNPVITVLEVAEPPSTEPDAQRVPDRPGVGQDSTELKIEKEADNAL